MARQRSYDSLSTDELRLLLVERRRAERTQRLEHFQRTRKVTGVELKLPQMVREVQEVGERETKTPPLMVSQPRPRAWWDRVLFVVEVLAVLGLFFVLLNGVKVLRGLNQEMVSVLAQPTLTPTPLIMAVVLPSGHTPPNAPGGVQPNEAEIPEHLRPLVQSMSNLPLPTVGPEQAVRIQIPAIGVDAPVVQGDGWEQLKKGVGQHVGTVNPGQKGNLVLSAHNDVFGEIFRELDQLKSGDQITVFTNQRMYTYLVRQTRIVEPTQVEVMSAGEETALTMISCYPYMVDNQRIVVSAVLQQ